MIDIEKCEPKTSVRQRLRSLQSGGQGSGGSTRTSMSFDVCMALEVDDDTFGFGHTCIDFQRSLAVPSSSCDLGYREQINQVTAFIDGSQIYGSTETMSSELRTHVNGTLVTSRHNFLPPEDNVHQQLYDECVTSSGTENCFKAGDNRVNVQPGLSSIHTLFMNEHNRIARILIRQLPSTVSSNNADEFVYQETRKIVGALLQHITYNEFLPVLLGEANMRKYNLLNNKLKRSKLRYNSQHQPGIRNEFATFAFRVGHSLVPEGLVPTDASYTKHGSGMAYFDNLLMNPHLLYRFGVGDVLRGVIAEPVKQPSPELSHHLEKTFRFSNRTAGGLDLAAVNIQRGRDHGVPSYTVMRRLCRLPVPESFADLDMPDKVKNKLMRVYNSVEDIDAWTGAVSERRMPGAMIGRLNACIIGRQFRSLRKGDRFWYEFQEPNVGFTNGQLAEIYNVTLATILCNNIENMATVQPQVFYLVQWNQLANRRVSCDQIPTLNLDSWFTK
ncbi:hypothetical protein EB796_005080 [Bugula neritina]|uniref:PXDN n=1 Tax=Bugula neritina TaxID=10212 RepID=A0A7J7KFF0_BUGNE|nr:hypothetical protein EB796_005080 [Bugula neritina]